MDAEQSELIKGESLTTARARGTVNPRLRAIRGAWRTRAARFGEHVVAGRLALTLILVSATVAASGLGAGGAGSPLYPDLRTVPPSDLYFDQLSDGTHILRFANTVWNAGEGRLELEGNPSPKGNPDVVRKVYQNLYDDPVAGSRTNHREVASDTVYHPGHQHYHFANLASYTLLKKQKRGAYKATVSKGTKTSYCVIDTDHFERDFAKMYGGCGRDLQGLTPGWGDTYGSGLVDQWVVLGASSLADGEYALQSIADPKNLLKEGGNAREKNNTATAYFTVKDGQIQNVRDKP